MAKEEKYSRTFNFKVYFRLLSYAKPYWFRLSVGIISGLLVGGSLFFALMMIPRMVGVVDPATGGKHKADTVAITSEAPTTDPQANELLAKASHYAKSYKLPVEVRGREIDVLWPKQFSFEVVGFDGRPGWQLLSLYAIGFVLAWLIKNLADYINKYCMRWVGNKVVNDMRNIIFASLMGQSLRFYATHDVGELISRSTNDTSSIEHAVSETISDLTSCPIQVLACLAAIFVACRDAQNYSLIIIVLCGMPLLLLPIFILGRLIRKIYRRSYARIANVTTRMHEVFTGIRIVKSYNTEKAEIERFRAVNRRYFRDVISAVKLQLLMSPLMEVVAVAATLFFLVYAYQRGVSMSQLAALLSPAFMAYRPLKDLSKVLTYIQRSMAAADR
ncbi:MAG: ABC transporter transmembrane domain-containing protein, partial [Victivallaceae bacterium]